MVLTNILRQYAEILKDSSLCERFQSSRILIHSPSKKARGRFSVPFLDHTSIYASGFQSTQYCHKNYIFLSSFLGPMDF
ncbi:hypothetical protein AX774_g726 [Zancudomyces culisetae]|uniref:Uncharacterized protein n=1 Tax=Zancudomyces culisetae TaxID=1213189 RepID=A0A1R1PXL3_ZANCU|nr:hypothetical protein AX774_g726 [Zancudomyces culisetae]|eukprot:OMH85725.1 hypothetical protein AX774_g726 [Zancudomyces culisetae]